MPSNPPTRNRTNSSHNRTNAATETAPRQLMCELWRADSRVRGANRRLGPEVNLLDETMISCMVDYTCSRSPRSKAFLASAWTLSAACFFNSRYSWENNILGRRGRGNLMLMTCLIVPGRVVMTITVSAR